jgi:circadian clock protein KaiC
MSLNARVKSTNLTVSTGITGLDRILAGGLPPDRIYLLEGSPGTGKTTLALQFLLEGRAQGEKALYVTLSETEDELRQVAESHGWSLDGINLYELNAAEGRLKPEEEYTVFRPEDVELTEMIEVVYAEVEQVKPSRVVFDSLSEMRLLAREPLRYRRQMLALKQFFTGRHCTVLLLDETNATDRDLQLQSISHGVISLERRDQEYGPARRRLSVVKLRGATFQEGYHDYTIVKGGLRVFPRLVAADHRAQHDVSRFESGIAELDELLGGGLYRGTSTLLIGPAGSGKSSIAGIYLRAATKRGEGAAVYLFEERRDIFLDRMAALGMDVRHAAETGEVKIQQIEATELSPGQFTDQLQQDVERGARLVIIDSLNGFQNAISSESALLAQMHEILGYLAEHGVLSILVLAQHGIIGSAMQTPIDISYLADTLILVRFFEFEGAVKRAISVIKHRKGAHEETIRAFELSAEGVRIGAPLQAFGGVLTGEPTFRGAGQSLTERPDGK